MALWHVTQRLDKEITHLPLKFTSGMSRKD